MFNTIALERSAQEIYVMTTTASVTATQVTAKASPMLAIFASLVLGFSTVFVVGHLQAETLHDAAHDVRHATGLPCH